MSHLKVIFKTFSGGIPLDPPSLRLAYLPHCSPFYPGGTLHYVHSIVNNYIKKGYFLIKRDPHDVCLREIFISRLKREINYYSRCKYDLTSLEYQ